MALLPSCILLKSNANGKFLRYTKDAGVPCLRFSQDQRDGKVELRYVKFEVEKAKVGNGLVHIRTCYNNKYWVRLSADSKHIVAGANEPEEDITKWSCTLFKPIFIDEAKDDSNTSAAGEFMIQLVHINPLGEQHARVSMTHGDNAYDLITSYDESGNVDDGGYDNVFIVSDGDSYLSLPDYLAFIGYNNKFVTPPSAKGPLYFESTDIGTLGVSTMLSQSTLERKFWAYSQPYSSSSCWRFKYPYISLVDGNSPDPDMSFTPTKVDNNVISLRYNDNNSFASCVSKGGGRYAFCASAPTVDHTAKLQLKEPVLRREVSDVVYDLDHSKVYDIGSVEKYKDTISNYSNSAQGTTLKASYTTSKVKSWKDDVSVTLGVATEFNCGVPFLVDGKVEVSLDVTGTREWGVEETTTHTREKEYNLTIPPMTKITLTVVASNAYCDVPLVCKVTDTMTDGCVRSYGKLGIFTGANEYDFEAQIVEEALQPKAKQASGI